MKVLIVDDEMITIKMLKSIIDWKSLGLDIMGYANNGIEAYNMVVEEKPDIILSDIRMTTMNGLELVKKVKILHKDIKIILMSAYANFEYVKEAMHLGCSDYILKPIDENELEQTLRKIVEEIRGIQNKNRIIDESLRHLRLYELYRYMRTGRNLNRIIKNKSDYSIEFENFMIVLIETDNNSISDYIKVNSMELLQQSYTTNMLKEIITDRYRKKFLNFPYEDDSYILMIESESQEEIEFISKEIKEIFSKELELDITIYFSKLGKNIEKIPELYKELKNLREKEFDEEIRRELSKDKKEELKKYSDSIEKCLKIIGEKYDKNITLDEITKEVAVSKNYFCYLFKKEMGMSLWSYLTQVRLDKAKELLKNTDMKTYEIAFKVGYDNPSYFSKIFKKIENMTPNEYREKII